MPSRFKTHELTSASRAMGELCLSIGQMPDGSVCNPAFLHEQGEGLLLGRVFIGNGFRALNTANQLIFQPISKEFLQDLFQNQNVTSVEAHAGLLFSAPYFSAGFSPYRIQYVSEAHNPNLPVIAVHAAMEQSLFFSGGVPLSLFNDQLGSWSAGGRVRFLRRKYIHGSFSLFQAVTDDPRTLLPVKEQRAFFVDPAIGWSLREHPWKPRASIGLSNVGMVSVDDPLYQDKMDVSLGAGIETAVALGLLRVGLDLVELTRAPDLFSRVRLGGAYRLGILESMIGVNKNATTLGLQFGIQVVQVGIVYEFVRDDFGGTDPESRVATEISVRL